jgi:methylphosphotriester-DNA--protein-cysteine methyltransferase
MIGHADITKANLLKLIAERKITLAGNRLLKIYGLLTCNSGRRMKKTNRVFFEDEPEAKLAGYRPCGSCMRVGFRKWRENRAK